MTYVRQRYGYLRECWKYSRTHWLGGAVSVLAAIYSFATQYGPLVRGLEFVSSLPKLQLAWAVVICLLALAFIAIEGGYRLLQRESEGSKALAIEKAKLQKEYEHLLGECGVLMEGNSRALEEVDKLQDELRRLCLVRPEIILMFDFEKRLLGERAKMMERPLILENRGAMDAYSVQVERVELRTGSATFPLLPRIERGGGKAEVEATVEKGGKVHPVFGKDFEALIREHWEADSDMNPDSIKRPDWEIATVPVSILFEDSRGRKYRAQHEIRYDALMSGSMTLLKSIEQLD